VDPAGPEGDSFRLYAFWHEFILLPIALRGTCNLSVLLSKHRDADIVSHLAHFMGFGCIRGSTTHGGAKALRELFQASRVQHLVFTPDGPRGPRRKMAVGPIYLASKLGLPLVVMGFGYDRPWRMKSWDRFAVPRPYSRARAVLGPAMHLPPKLDREGLEHYRLEVERLLNRLTDEAEAWAEAGTRKVNEVCISAHSVPPVLRQDVAHAVPRPQFMRHAVRV
jgi:lysophospholipid acyltransferase (LPLAT)-like uncharacterized protein